MDLLLSAILQINASSALADPFGGAQSDIGWRSDATAVLFLTFPSKKLKKPKLPGVSSPPQLLKLGPLLSRFRFPFLLMSDQTC